MNNVLYLHIDKHISEYVIIIIGFGLLKPKKKKLQELIKWIFMNLMSHIVLRSLKYIPFHNQTKSYFNKFKKEEKELDR